MLDDRVAVVTGAESGLGQGIALALAQAGAKVVVADLAEGETVSTIEAAGGEAAFVACDVSDATAVEGLRGAAADRFGRIDIWVNNAGVHPGTRLLHEYSVDELELSLRVNLMGNWFGAQSAVRQFLSQGDGGNLISVVSTAGLQGHPRQAVYNVAKGGAAQIIRCVAIDYGRNGIRANGICPTFVKTPMSKHLYEVPAIHDMIADSLPLKRWGEIDDVASLAVFLASDASSFLTGTLTPIDGGETLSRYSVEQFDA